MVAKDQKKCSWCSAIPRPPTSFSALKQILSHETEEKKHRRGAPTPVATSPDIPNQERERRRDELLAVLQKYLLPPPVPGASEGTSILCVWRNLISLSAGPHP